MTAGAGLAPGLTLVFDTSLSAGTTVEVPLNGTVDATVDWGDGNTDSYAAAGNRQHTYAAEGTYTVQVTGTVTQFGYGSGSPSSNTYNKLTECASFGEIGVTSLQGAFRDATNLTVAPTGLPFNSSVTDMSYMFRNASSFNQDISSWDVSSVIDMSFMFYGVTSFNQDIGTWNVGSVTNMSSMFYSASVFNQDISSWDVSNVLNTSSMFLAAGSFNQDIGSWNVSSVSNMFRMFYNADAFDQDISSWDFSGLNSLYDLNEFMLAATGLSSTNYDALLVAWSEAADAGTIYSPLSPNMGGSEYSSLAGQLARENLISTHGWTITDGGLASGAAAGPTLWLDAADTTSITESGGAVSQWDDKSGNGYDVTQGTAANQPTTGATTLNSLNVLDFNSDVLTASSLTLLPSGSASRTVFFVYKPNQSANAWFYSYGSRNQYEAFGYGRATNNHNFAGFGYDWNSGVSAALQWQIITFHFDGTNLNLFVNNTNVGSNNMSLLNTTTTSFSIGEFIGDTPNEKLSVAEFLIYNSALSISDRTEVETYLSSKWGITI